MRTTLPVKVIFELKNTANLETALKAYEEARDAHPDIIIDTEIRVRVMEKRTASDKKQSTTFTQSITGRFPEGQSNDVINEQMQIIKSVTRSLINKGSIL